MLSTAPSNLFAQETNETQAATVQTCWLDKINIPSPLQAHGHELDQLLNKVFKNCPETNQNIELAKQLAINWCSSKCKELDIPAESYMAQLSR